MNKPTTLHIDFDELATSEIVATFEKSFVTPQDFMTINDRILTAVSDLTGATENYIESTYQAVFSTYYSLNASILAVANSIDTDLVDWRSLLIMVKHSSANEYLDFEQLPMLFMANVVAYRCSITSTIRRDVNFDFGLLSDLLTACILVVLLNVEPNSITWRDVLVALDRSCGEYWVDQQDNHGVRFVEAMGLDVDDFTAIFVY